MKLALQLGFPSVDNMLARMTPREFTEWRAYYSIEPWGDDWTRTGTLAAVIHDAITRFMLFKNKERMERKHFAFPFNYIPIPKWLYTKKKRQYETWQSSDPSP